MGKRLLFILVILTAISGLLCSCEQAVEEVAVSSVTISQPSVEMIIGETITLTATVSPSNATDQEVTWASSEQSVATVDYNGKVDAVSEGSSTITAAAGGKVGSCTIVVTKKTIAVTSISLDKPSITIKVGESETLAATITPADATNKNVFWTTSNIEVVAVENGKVTGVKPGSATITVTTEDGRKTAECAVTIKSNLAPSVTVGADHVSAVSAILSGEANLETTISSDMTMGIMWSLNSGVLPANSTKIEARDIKAKAGFEASYEYCIGITGLEPETTYYYRSYVTQNGQDTYGIAKEFKTKELSSLLETRDATSVEAASAYLNAKLDLTDVAYTSIDYGFLWGLSESTLQNKVKGSEVNDNHFDAPISGLNHNTQYWFKSYITIDSRSFYGEVRSYTTGVIPVQSVLLNSKSYSFDTIGSSITLTATVYPTDATDKRVKWTTSNTSVASVDEKGKVTAIGNGNAVITVSTVDGNKEGKCSIWVEQKVIEIVLDKTDVSLNEGETAQLTATVIPDNAANKSISWISFDDSIATVDENGLVRAISKGTARIDASATDGTGKSASCYITVQKLVSSITFYNTDISIFIGSQITLSPTVLPVNADNRDLTWSSSDESVATVSQEGVVTGLSRGTVSITAMAKDGSGVAGECTIKVKQPVTEIVLERSSYILRSGTNISKLFKAVLPEDADNKELWIYSDNSFAAYIDETHTLITVSRGEATITAEAADGSGIKASFTVKVHDPAPSGAVDMGLSVCWAETNLGASKPEEYGDYYAWGEVEPYYTSGHSQDNPCEDWKEGKTSGYGWPSYKWADGAYNKLTKYCPHDKQNQFTVGGGYYDESRLGDYNYVDDAARVILGNPWRFPSVAEWNELMDPNNCNWQWTTKNGIKGFLVSSIITKGSIFIPAAGVRFDKDYYHPGDTGGYWSSELDLNRPCAAWRFYLTPEKASFLSNDRCSGFSVRAVAE